VAQRYVNANLLFTCRRRGRGSAALGGGEEPVKLLPGRLAPSPVHSACVGADVEFHYRWHALYGGRLRLHYSEVRNGARLSFVEADPGVVIVMLS
jgi:hypothetical protein